ncbi:hypothetical protein BDR05DRAFT_942653 [Suillus weaverae]|nr:hypothetical protein BDR05DRAFT_942653 [Suillus weaverae]
MMSAGSSTSMFSCCVVAVGRQLNHSSRSIAWELPNNVPYQAKANLIAQFTKLWVAPSERCLAGINDVLDQVIDTLISTHFGRFKVLEGYVGELIRTQVGVCKARAQEAVKTALALETTPHYTQNTHYLQTLREKWLAHYKTVKPAPHATVPQQAAVWEPPLTSRVPSTPETPEAKALRALAEAGYANLTTSALARLLPPDTFQEELIVMADVRAYFHVAYKVSLVYRLRLNLFIPRAAHH